MAQDNSSSSSVAQRCQKVGHPHLDKGWPVELVILMSHQRGNGGCEDKLISHSMFSWGMNILLSTLVPKFDPSVAFYYTNSLHFSCGHFVCLFCLVFSLFLCYLAFITRLKGLETKGDILHCLCDRHSI